MRALLESLLASDCSSRVSAAGALGMSFFVPLAPQLACVRLPACWEQRWCEETEMPFYLHPATGKWSYSLPSVPPEAGHTQVTAPVSTPAEDTTVQVQAEEAVEEPRAWGHVPLDGPGAFMAWADQLAMHAPNAEPSQLVSSLREDDDFFWLGLSWKHSA